MNFWGENSTTYEIHSLIKKVRQSINIYHHFISHTLPSLKNKLIHHHPPNYTIPYIKYYHHSSTKTTPAPLRFQSISPYCHTDKKALECKQACFSTFSKFDSNSHGFISLQNTNKGFEEQSLACLDKHLKKVVSIVNKNSTGQYNYSQIVKFLRKNCTLVLEQGHILYTAACIIMGQSILARCMIGVCIAAKNLTLIKSYKLLVYTLREDISTIQILFLHVKTSMMSIRQLCNFLRKIIVVGQYIIWITTQLFYEITQM